MKAQPRHQKPSQDTIDALVRIVGEEHAIREEEAMTPYLVEWRDRYRGKAALVLRPGETEEVAAILKCANETKTAIVPQGGNTGLVGGQIPFETGHEVVVALERLNRVRDIDLASNTMTVEAGLVLALAQQVAASAGRLFPLSLASEGSAQIGGVLATNAGGMAVLAYGSARDLTLGLEVVFADGRVWNGLKSLRKDNSGYDLKDLIIGSEGTLGIITAAVLRLFPKIAERVTCMAGLNALDTAPEFFARALGRAVRRAPLQAQVARDDVQQAQMLALVLVDALDLDVEQRVRIHHHAGAAAHAKRQPLFVRPLDPAPALPERPAARAPGCSAPRSGAGSRRW